MLSIDWDPPAPLVKRRNRLCVTERVNYKGDVITPLNEVEARNVTKILKRSGVESVVIAFLNSYMNSVNEQRMKEIVREECPNAFVCTSSELIPVMREFERTTTAVANGYVGPLMERYLSSLEGGCSDLRFTGDLLLMQSHGGVMSSDFAKKSPVRTVMSGPAAGVIAAKAIGEAAGATNIISFDMGGTSTDVSVIPEGEIKMTDESSAEFGVPILFPSILVESIGAGGGTIAWIDEFGNLKSGPRSAGAFPGPACYGKGGESATVTDAHVLLGRFDPKMFLGGAITLQESLAKKAIERLASEFKHDLTETACGILRITDSNMEKAIRRISIERGYDPRDFSLVAFGGAGPLHCVSVAREMNIPQVIIPPRPGLTSALGLLYSDIKHDHTRSYNKVQDKIDFGEVEGLFSQAEQTLRNNFEKEGFTRDRVVINRKLQMRYYGGFEPYTIPVPVPNEAFTEAVFSSVVERFAVLHEKEFGYSLKGHHVVVEMIRVEGVAVTQKPPFKALELGGEDPSSALRTAREVYFEESGFVKTEIYDREKLHPGVEVTGPAIIEQMDSTTVLPPEVSARVDAFNNIVVKLEGS